MAERFKAPVLKTGRDVVPRGFESHSIRICLISGCLTPSRKSRYTAHLGSETVFRRLSLCPIISLSVGEGVGERALRVPPRPPRARGSDGAHWKALGG